MMTSTSSCTVVKNCADRVPCLGGGTSPAVRKREIVSPFVPSVRPSVLVDRIPGGGCSSRVSSHLSGTNTLECARAFSNARIGGFNSPFAAASRISSASAAASSPASRDDDIAAGRHARAASSVPKTSTTSTSSFDARWWCPTAAHARAASTTNR